MGAQRRARVGGRRLRRAPPLRTAAAPRRRRAANGGRDIVITNRIGLMRDARARSRSRSRPRLRFRPGPGRDCECVNETGVSHQRDGRWGSLGGQGGLERANPPSTERVEPGDTASPHGPQATEPSGTQSSGNGTAPYGVAP